MAQCTLCYDVGWVLDCNDVGKPGPRMLEFIPCFKPDCQSSGQEIQSICFKGILFQSVAKHPISGCIMSISNPAL